MYRSKEVFIFILIYDKTKDLIEHKDVVCAF